MQHAKNVVKSFKNPLSTTLVKEQYEDFLKSHVTVMDKNKTENSYFPQMRNSLYYAGR
jgi:hypothetical protein